MEADHAHLWRRMIELLGEADLSRSSVMDFGCNQGGFLHMLYGLKPFRLGVGIDKAEASLDAAQRRTRAEPIRFYPPSSSEAWKIQYDYVFSQEVLYLLPDLYEHARKIHAALKDGGIYFAAIGCHTENPLWNNWKKIIGANCRAVIFDYSPDDCAKAFFSAGFKVSAKKFMIDGFISLKPDDPYFPRTLDALNYNTEYKILFRCVK